MLKKPLIIAALFFCISMLQAPSLQALTPEECKFMRVFEIYKNSAQAALTREQLARLLALPIVEDIKQFKFDGPIYETITGFKYGTKIISTKGRVFRHYTIPARYEKILREKKLVAGTLSYAQVGGGTRADYPEMTGVFLTLTTAQAGEVGLHPNAKAWVDVELPDHPYILEVEPNIFMIPGFPDLLGHFRKDYDKWKAALAAEENPFSPPHNIGPEYIPYFKLGELIAEHTLSVPIKIVGSHSQNDKGK